MTDSELPPQLAGFAQEFFAKAEDVVEQFEATGDHAPIRALAADWYRATQPGPPRTHFAELVTLAMDITAGLKGGDAWPLLDLSIGAWRAMIADPQFEHSVSQSRGVTWNNLAQNLVCRFRARGAERDLDDAVAAQQEAVRATDAQTANRSDYYAGLSFLLLKRGNLRDDDSSRAASVDVMRGWVAEQKQGSAEHLSAIHMMANAVKSWSGEAEAAAFVDDIRGALLLFGDRPSRLQLTAQLATALRNLAQKRPDTASSAIAEVQEMLREPGLPNDVAEYLEDELGRLGAIVAIARFSG